MHHKQPMHMEMYTPIHKLASTKTVNHIQLFIIDLQNFLKFL